MKKILMALAMTGFTYFSAEAQTDGKKSCEVNQNKVCTKSGGQISCYKTKYAENFKVCKNDLGYYICCETPDYNNTTHRGTSVAVSNQYPADDFQTSTPSASDFVAPAKQSTPQYSVNRANSYEGYYYYAAQKGKIKVCYVGDNVAELTRAPWQGCPSPEFDGPDKNRERNMNVISPTSK